MDKEIYLTYLEDAIQELKDARICLLNASRYKHSGLNFDESEMSLLQECEIIEEEIKRVS